ncbi:MAG: quinone-dependent dihydroorotate dehydrogenase [Rhodospirillaceae bacterium]|jgi:dihydroorotate dehydrogenase|nr:quinone-dependent dihydroorotate dehydrogenase [Rhodospirillaceae bacterium]MBT5665642.1 quinone-dependent dihydroorotate dehydrogenase [Rhodospirillaceae bacterium]MBT5812177.1 quinone-dependent dihydroorotate dehydrogenase [Rhodospirillaceae bacterium]
MSLAALAMPFLRRLDPERAHNLTVWALAHGFGPTDDGVDDPVLRCRYWGHEFPNPIGVAAGFDKDARAYAALLRMGFGFTEIGTVTPRPQVGNPKPRLFRLPRDRAVINRMGFNNQGMEAAAGRLADRDYGGAGGGIVGVNVGKNKETEDAAVDYEACAARLAPFADYLVINVSSPNTPGLRALQDADVLARLITVVRAAAERTRAGPLPPLLVKIAPDLTMDDKRDIAAMALDQAVDGLIISNTTIERPDCLTEPAKTEAGGLSGAPLLAPSTAVLADMYRLTEGRLTLIGAGGVASGADAYAKIRAGASLVQLYTAMALNGPGLIRDIKVNLAERLKADGHASVADAVGVDHR